MTKTALYSKMRKILRDVGRRQIWQKAMRALVRFSKQYGQEIPSYDPDGPNLHQKLQVFTGKEHVVLERQMDPKLEWITIYRVDFSNPSRSGTTIFSAYVVHPGRRENAKDELLKMRYHQVGKSTWIYVTDYHPGPWEGVLEIHEMKRLLKERREVERSLANRKAEEEKQKNDSEPLNQHEEDVAKHFGIKTGAP